MSYIDGFVAAVPTANREAYRKHVEHVAPIFKEHGNAGNSRPIFHHALKPSGNKCITCER